MHAVVRREKVFRGIEIYVFYRHAREVGVRLEGCSKCSDLVKPGHACVLRKKVKAIEFSKIKVLA